MGGKRTLRSIALVGRALRRLTVWPLLIGGAMLVRSLRLPATGPDKRRDGFGCQARYDATERLRIALEWRSQESRTGMRSAARTAAQLVHRACMASLDDTVQLKPSGWIVNLFGTISAISSRSCERAGSSLDSRRSTRTVCPPGGRLRPSASRRDDKPAFASRASGTAFRHALTLRGSVQRHSRDNQRYRAARSPNAWRPATKGVAMKIAVAVASALCSLAATRGRRSSSKCQRQSGRRCREAVGRHVERHHDAARRMAVEGTVQEMNMPGMPAQYAAE